LNGPSNYVQWAISLVTALLDGDDLIIGELVQESEDSEMMMLGLAALSVVLLRLREAGGNSSPQQTLQAVAHFVAEHGLQLDGQALIDLDKWAEGT